MGWKRAANSACKFLSHRTPGNRAKLKPVTFLPPTSSKPRVSSAPRIIAPVRLSSGFQNEVSFSPQNHLVLLFLQVFFLRTLAGPQQARKHPNDWEIGLSRPELGLPVYGRDPSLLFRNWERGFKYGKGNPKIQGSSIERAGPCLCALVAQRTSPHAGSMKMCWASAFSSLGLSFCICKMGRAHSQRARWSPWGQLEDSCGTETAGLSPRVALQAGR